MNGNGAAPPAAPSEDWRNRIKKLANLGVSMSEDDDLCTFGGPTMADDKRPFPQRWGSDVWRERSVQGHQSLSAWSWFLCCDVC